MIIYLVRHGKDDDKYRGGWSNLGLTEEGIEQSKLLGKYLSENRGKYKIGTLISSDFKRTLETANEIKNRLNIPIKMSDEWREMNNGVLAGMLNEEALKKYPGLYFITLKMDEKYPEGESPREFYIRIKESFNNLCSYRVKEQIGPNIMIITHSGVINIIYHVISNLEWTNKSPALCNISNTGIHKIEYIEGKWKVIHSNELKHIT